MKTPHTAKILAFTMLLSFLSLVQINTCYSAPFAFGPFTALAKWVTGNRQRAAEADRSARIAAAKQELTESHTTLKKTYDGASDLYKQYHKAPTLKEHIQAGLKRRGLNDAEATLEEAPKALRFLPVIGDVAFWAAAPAYIAVEASGPIPARRTVNYGVIELKNNSQGYKLAKCDCKHGENDTPAANTISANRTAPEPNTTFSVLRAKNDHGADCTLTYSSDKTKKEIALHVHQGWAEFGVGGQIQANWEDVGGIPDAGTIALTRGQWDWKDLKEISPTEAIKRIHNKTGSRPGLVEVELNNNI